MGAFVGLLLFSSASRVAAQSAPAGSATLPLSMGAATPSPAPGHDDCFEWQGKRWKWIDSKTGETIKTAPLGSSPKDFNGDFDHWSNPRNGRNYVKLPNGSWVDSKTGETIRAAPLGSSPEDFNGDFDHWSNPRNGRNYVLVPCGEAEKQASNTPTPKGATSPSAGVQPVSTSSSSINGYFGAEYGGYSMHSNGMSWTSGVASLGGAFAFPIDLSSSVQWDGDYSRLHAGQGAPNANAWDGDVHYDCKSVGIPVGGFVGGFSSNGTSTWGGGLEVIAPLNPCSWETQLVYAHTDKYSTGLWGGRTELRCFPTDDLRLSASFGAQHTSSTYAPGFTYTDNIYSVGLDAEARLFNSPWCVFGEYEHTHFRASGMNADGFIVGLRFSFGGTLKDRETQGPAFTNFAHLLGVGYKF